MKAWADQLDPAGKSGVRAHPIMYSLTGLDLIENMI